MGRISPSPHIHETLYISRGFQNKVMAVGELHASSLQISDTFCRFCRPLTNKFVIAKASISQVHSLRSPAPPPVAAGSQAFLSSRGQGAIEPGSLDTFSNGRSGSSLLRQREAFTAHPHIPSSQARSLRPVSCGVGSPVGNTGPPILRGNLSVPPCQHESAKDHSDDILASFTRRALHAITEKSRELDLAALD